MQPCKTADQPYSDASPNSECSLLGGSPLNSKGREDSPLGGRITVQLVSSLLRLDLTKEENMLFFVCSEAVESKLVKLETSRTVIFPPTVSVLMLHYFIYLGMQSIIVAQC